MSGESWGALIGLGVYFGMKAIDRFFRVVDHALDERLHDDSAEGDEDADEPVT